jgi:hypothetical protein
MTWVAPKTNIMQVLRLKLVKASALGFLFTCTQGIYIRIASMAEEAQRHSQCKAASRRLLSLAAGGWAAAGLRYSSQFNSLFPA